MGSHNNNVFTPLLKSIRQNYISDVTVKIYIDRKKITMIKMNKKKKKIKLIKNTYGVFTQLDYI